MDLPKYDPVEMIDKPTAEIEAHGYTMSWHCARTDGPNKFILTCTKQGAKRVWVRAATHAGALRKALKEIGSG